MAEDFYDYEDDVLPRKKDNLFLWTILILLLIGAAFACWLGSFYIFGHPEEAESYKILKKLKKIEVPRRFDVTAAPQGEFISAQKAYERFSTLTKGELQRENAELLRIYIKNYTETKKLVPYLRGKFDVMETRELTSSDLFTSGTVSLMQAADYAQVVVEHIFPSTGSNVEAGKRAMAAGSVFPIEKTNDVTAIIHAERLNDGRLLLTVVPLHYPVYGVTVGAGNFATEPPLELNVAAGLPVVKPAAMENALKQFAQLRANEPVQDTPKAATPSPGIVRVDNVPIGHTAPETGAIPEPPVARAQAVSPVMPTPRPRPPVTELTMNNRTAPALGAATPLPVGKARPVATPEAAPLVEQPPATPARSVLPTKPAATPPIVAMSPPPLASSPSGPPPAVSPNGVPLKPFVQSNQGVAPMTDNSGSWRLYQAGAQPRGRVISSTEVAGMVDRGDTGERLYLSGNFFVSARGDNKAVLRPRGESLPSDQEVRIVAEYPNGALPPEEGEVFARDASRAFEVRAINRASDGRTINVYVREVTR